MRATALTAAILVGIASARVEIQWGGGIYSRFMVEPMGSTFELMGAEASLVARVSGADRDYFSAAIQFAGPGAMDGWTRGFHFGQTYVLIPLGLRWPSVKVGQAVVPFGLLADYDVHAQIIQTPYARVIGLRLDPGAGIEGSLGPTGYRLWVSNGNGPDVLDQDRNKVITARIAPRFLLGDAELTVGLSGLSGSLPYWPIESLGRMSAGPRSYTVKHRLGLDNTTDWGPLTFRLEVVAGRDSSLAAPLVGSGFAEARWAVTSWLEPVVKLEEFRPAGGSYRSAGTGVNFYPPGLGFLQVQTLFEKTWLKTALMNDEHWHATAQLAVAF